MPLACESLLGIEISTSRKQVRHANHCTITPSTHYRTQCRNISLHHWLAFCNYNINIDNMLRGLLIERRKLYAIEVNYFLIIILKTSIYCSPSCNECIIAPRVSEVCGKYEINKTF